MTLADRMAEKYGPFMDVSELAELLRIKRTTLYNQIYNGTLVLPHIRRGKRYLFPTDDVVVYLNEALRRGSSTAGD